MIAAQHKYTLVDLYPSNGFHDHDYDESFIDDDSTNERLFIEWVGPSNISESVEMHNTPIPLKRLDYEFMAKGMLYIITIQANGSERYTIELPESNVTSPIDIGILEIPLPETIPVNLSRAFYFISLTTAVSFIVNGFINIKPVSPFFILGSAFFLITLFIPLLEQYGS